jgi:hypothetical protein
MNRMSPYLMCVPLLTGAIEIHADQVPASSAQPSATRPRQALAVPSNQAETAGAQSASPDTEAPKFVSEARWGMAGYNNNEVYYTVFVTNQEARILRCTTEIKGFYFENGEKLSIADRQITTVFPNQPTQVGIWMDMDQSSGATYSVKCHPI